MTLIKNINNSGNFRTDEQLVSDYKQTLNNQIIGELFTRYHHIVFGVALKYLKDTELAQDALLDVFNNLFEHLLKYKIDDFKSWLLTVTRNHSLRVLKDASKSSPLEYAHVKNLSINFMENEHEIDLINDKEKQLKQLEQALNKLKPEQNKCVKLFYLQDKSYHEVASITGYNLKKVKSHIQNGKRNLYLILSNPENE